ncbi:MAG: response regulator, partial [Bdellovibrionota bacterium]
EVHGILDDVIRTGKTAELHEIPITLGSSLRFFNLTYSARRDLEGQINGVMILGTEVTGEVQAREKIKRSEAELATKTAQLETIIEQMPMAVVFADAKGKLVFANKQVEKVWRHGFIPSETIEEYREYIGFHPDGRRFEGKDWPIARALLTGEVVVNEDIDVLRGDDTRGIIRISAAPVKNSAGEIIGGVVVSEDVTEQKRFELDLKQAKEEAERANELKSAFLANMSHEIRTPLGAMIGFADLLRDPGLAPGERDNYTEILARNGESLSVIINDILDLSKVEAGQLTLEFSETSPSEIAEDVVSLLRVKAKEKDLAFDFHCEDDVPKQIVSDSIRIRQVLLNIVANAIKFTQYGSVKVRCYGCKNDEGRRSVCFEVADTGIGIPFTQKDKIFEMFVQADGSMTRRFGGTGLGLALSKRLALALGGDIRITETEPGKGSTFLITVEDQPEKKNSTHGPERTKKDAVEVKPNALEGLSVLVVDDSPDNRQLIWHYLSKQGAFVETAENGLIGYRQAIAGNYDIVLMDIQMPEMDGYTATHKLRAAGFRKPILALTAHAMTDVRQKCLNVGCTGHLPKPIDRQMLISTILEYVNH